MTMARIIKLLLISLGLTCFVFFISSLRHFFWISDDSETLMIAEWSFILCAVLMWASTFVGNNESDPKYLNKFLCVPIIIGLIGTILYFVSMVFYYSITLGIALIALLLILLAYRLKRLQNEAGKTN